PLRLVRSRTNAFTSSAVIRPPASVPFTCVRSTANSRASRRTDGGAGMAAPEDDGGVAAVLFSSGTGGDSSVFGGAGEDDSAGGGCEADATAGSFGVDVLADCS